MTSSSEAPAKATPAKVETRALGKYELQKQLGAGGMGTVYLAKDTQLKRLVALKILSRDKASNPTLVKRFQAEAQAAAQLRHDNIVAIYENGELDGHLFIAMEYIDGTDAQELIRKRGKLPVKRALEIVKQVAKALQHAHEHRIVHRDIKPSNLLIRNDGAVKVADLGLARSVDDTLATDITRAGTTVGTVDYMSPEQARNSKLADIRSDIYSLGCTWFHMLTGQPPFPEGSMTNKLQAHAVKSPPDPRDDNELVTEGTVAVLQRMMAKKPEDRYQTPEELLKDLASPSLTRGGAEQEMYSAISESEDAVASPKPAKRGLPAGMLPPKLKKAAQVEEEESNLNWETLQPLLWGGLILSVIVGLGLLVAGLSGNLDFGSGPVAKPTNAELGSGETSTTVKGSQNANAAQGQATSTSVTAPDTKVLSSDDPNALTTPDQPPQVTVATPQPADIPGTNNSNPNNPTTTDPSNPSTGTTQTPPASSQSPGAFDPESVPTWSAPSASRTPSPGGQPGKTPGKSPGTTPGPKSALNQPGVNPGPSLKIVTVGSGVKTANHFPNLAEALRSLPAEGAVVRMTGPGPYELPRIQLSSLKRLVWASAEGQHPVILLRPAPGELTAGLQMAEGALEIEGLHFVLDRSMFGGSDPVKMISVVDGQLTVSRSTFSVWGTGSVPVWALHVDSRLEPQGRLSVFEPRVLIDQVFVRGDDVTAFSVSRPSADVVVRDSLLASGTAPVVLLSGKFPDQVAKSLPSGKTRRAVRFLNSTLFSRRTVFHASADGAAIPPDTAITLQESVCATTAPAGEAHLLNAGGWPQSTTAAAKGRLVNLSWLMKDSVAFGFRDLAELGADSAFTAHDLDGWQTLWNKSFTAVQFPSTPWPAGPLADLSALRPADFNRETLPTRDVLRPDNTPPGCETPRLPDPAAVSRRRISALAAKPSFPTAPDAPPTQTVQIDATKQDLGRELQNGAWPAGTLIEVTGVGLRPMTPVKLTDKSWKIVGRPQDGAPLTFTPKDVKSDLEALVVAERGSLELSNIRFQILTTKKSPLKSLIVGREARLILDNVDLQGALTDPGTLDALLHWSGGAAGDDGTTPVLMCQDSTFIGSGRAARLELGAGPIFLRNCLVVSRGDGLDVRILSTVAGPSPGAIVADHVTFSATSGAIHLQSDATDPARPPHRFYFHQCAFVPPLSSRAGEAQAPALFSLSNPDADLRAVEWWGSSNGLSPEIPHLIRAEKDLKPNEAQSGLGRWQSLWNEEQDTRFLTVAGGVVLAEPLSSKSNAVKPSQFALHPSCKAAKWGDGERPIGADVRRLELQTATAKPKDKAPGKKPLIKGPVAPDF